MTIMPFSKLYTILPALLSTTLAASATINNHCPFPIYAWVVGADESPSSSSSSTTMHTITSGSSFSSPYQQNVGGGGVSIKVSRVPDDGNDDSGQHAISQLEYTDSAGTLWYDLSNVNGDAFTDEHVVLTPIAAQSATCAVVDCPSGQQACHNAYTGAHDDWATHACAQGTDLVYDLCVP